MQCPTCKREMVHLFLTQACDYCDYGIPEDRRHSGYIVYRPDTDHPQPHDEYVFRTRMDAERWRAVSNREGCSIYKVWSLAPFQWHLSRGTLRDVVLADHLFEVWPDHRYEPLNYRCWLGGKEAESSSPAVAEGLDDVPF